MTQLQELISKAGHIYIKNFPLTTNFERAIFFSWYCATRDCTFCYMSTQKTAKTARRTQESILAELILCKKLKWDIGFLSGGHKAYTKIEFLELLKNINKTINQKVWINVGPLTKQELKQYKPYIKGVVASIETINPRIHKNVCPSKPTTHYEMMLKEADKLGLKKAITIIIGLGETIDDFKLLKDFIRKYKINKIHIYALNPQKGTVFENTKSPIPEYQAEWIAKTRIAFPNLDIQFGIWKDKVKRISLLLEAGANSISKFPAIRYFNSKQAKEIEKQSKKAKRKFKGTLTKVPKINIEKEVNKLKINREVKEKIKKKLEQYLKTLST